MDFANYDGPIVRSSEPEPGASFATVDGVPLPDRGGGRDVGAGPLTPGDSGSACCVSIRWQDDNDGDASGVGGGGGVGAGKKDGEGRRLLLGFSHRKTRRGLGRDSPQYNFVSRLYVNPRMRTISLCVMRLPICEFFCVTPRTHMGTPCMHTGTNF